MQAHLNPILGPMNQRLEELGANADNTDMYMFATGGMRSLNAADHKTALGLAREVIQNFPNRRYAFVASNVRTITGQQEGWFAWVYQNYGLTQSRGGSLEMGGASIQYAYRVNAPNPDTAPICSDPKNRTYNETVYSETWEGLGSRSLNDDLVTSLNNSINCPNQPCKNPCLPKGMLATRKNVETVGTGDFEACGAFAASSHKDRRLPILTPLPGTHLQAISSFYYTYVFFMPHEEALASYDANLFKTRVQKYCEDDWHGVNPDGSNRTIHTETMCLNAAWMMVSFEDASTQITFTQGVTWTNGAAALIANNGGLRLCPDTEELPQHQPLQDGNLDVSFVRTPQNLSLPTPAKVYAAPVSATPLITFCAYLPFVMVLVFIGRLLVQRSRAKAHGKIRLLDLEENALCVGAKENMQDLARTVTLGSEGFYKD